MLGQALSAAGQTVPPERRVHSLHAYFLRPGNVSKPIIYEVDRIRDGSSFTTRRVVAIQNGHPIFNLSTSFQIDEPGFQHQSEMPAGVPDPETVPRDVDRFSKDRPIDLRIVGERQLSPNPEPQAPKRLVWLKAAAALPDDPVLHAYLLAYASDFAFVTTAMLPHGKSWLTPGMQVASIDHVMWFHRPFRIDEWLLYAMDSPSAQGARGLARGSVFTKDGILVASSAQEGLMRQR